MNQEQSIDKEITLKLKANTVRILIVAAQRIDPAGIFFEHQIANIRKQLQEQMVDNNSDEDFTLPSHP